MKEDLLKDLNKEQKEAVLHTDGPMIILAGAGSGKTRVLVYKVMYLMQEKRVFGDNILMITFTNKAANEMKERVVNFLFKSQLPTANGQKPFVATFHALCAKILRIEGQYIGLSSRFVIYDVQDQIDAIKDAMEKLGLSTKEYKPGSIHATISQAKNQLISGAEYRSFARGHFQEIVAAVYPLYQQILKDNDAVDFDDLLLRTIELFEKNPNVLEKYQNKFRYILIDEYQDTNMAQYKLTKLLAEKWKNVCVVGDFSQSIYSWRGANFQNLITFKTDFPGTKTFSLSQNYRSTQKILDAAFAVISKNTSHPILKLWTENDSGADIVLFEARNEQEEAEFILRNIHSIKDLKAIAVLYRTNAQSRTLEEVFLHQGLPYVLVGGTRFYERKEVKDVVSYLRVIANPKDSVSEKRIQKLGKGRYEKFLVFKQSLTTPSPLPSPARGEGIAPSPLMGEGGDEGKALQTILPPTIDLLDAVLKATGYLDLYNEEDPEDRARLENIKELRSVAISFPNLDMFLENIALVEQEYMPDHPESGEKKNAITMMTMHAAKGLEFPMVFMVGMEEGLFPHSRSLMDKNELEEERRLCYVGMTRAKQKLFLTYAKRRLYFGQRTQNIISRFIMELPEDILENNMQMLRTERDQQTDYF